LAYSKNWTIMSNPPWAENSLHISSCKYIPEHYTCFFTKPMCTYTHFGWCSEELSVVDQCDNLPPSLISQSHAFLESNIHISPNHVMYTGLIWYIHWQQGISRWCKGYEEVVMTWAVVGMQLK
jgi:hypothetical protein